MTFDHDDPRWTAYVLGELDADASAELESELADNQSALAYVTQLQETTDLLMSELGGGDAPGLTDNQRAAIADAAAAEDRPVADGDVTAAPGADADATADATADVERDADVIDIRRARRRTWLLAIPGLAAAAALLLFVMPGSKRKQSSESANKAQIRAQASPSGAAKVDHTFASDLSNRPNNPVNGVVLADPTPADNGATASSEQSVVSVADSTTSAMEPGYWNHRNGITAASGDAYKTNGREQYAFKVTPQTKPTTVASVHRRADRDPAAVADSKTPPPDETAKPVVPAPNTETYDRIVENPFVAVADDPRSTFSIDVDTASYANTRRYLTGGTRPPRGAVRIEEFVNYFSYQYPGPKSDAPFAVHVEMAPAPWNRANQLMKIGIKGKDATGARPRANLVFLLDVSGSMESRNKLPLLRRALSMLVTQLDEEDRVSIVVYAGASGLVLPATAAADKHKITSALERLAAGGSTNGGQGIELAYRVAAQNFVKGGINRVILATDGDFNVGTTNRSELVRTIESKAKTGVYLTVLGFGMGNYKDSTLEQLADHGNGNYAYIDTIGEARKVLVDEVQSTLMTIAKDVKLQLEFNPVNVSAFRLIGYENRVLAHRDFNDDSKDAGEIGAGHTVTALYEIVPTDAAQAAGEVDALKYQRPTTTTDAAHSAELVTLKIRYKAPDGDRSQLSEWPIRDQKTTLRETSRDFSFAAAVAAFGMILRDSQHRGDATLGLVKDLATRGAKVDRFGYRAEFLQLVDKARSLGLP